MSGTWHVAKIGQTQNSRHKLRPIPRLRNLVVKIKFLVVLVTGLVMACSQHQPSPNSQAALQEQACAQGGFYSPLPVNIQLASPFHLRSDRIATNKQGKVRRRVTLEMLQGTGGEAFADASRSLLAAGYEVKGQLKGEPTARQSQGFIKKGHPSIVLISNVDVGAKPANPDAKGLLAVEWTPPGVKPTVVSSAASAVSKLSEAASAK